MLLVIFTIQHKVCTSNRQKQLTEGAQHKKSFKKIFKRKEMLAPCWLPFPSFCTLLFLTNPINITFSVSIINYLLASSTYSK